MIAMYFTVSLVGLRCTEFYMYVWEGQIPPLVFEGALGRFYGDL